jgi:hypothetical protein
MCRRERLASNEFADVDDEFGGCATGRWAVGEYDTAARNSSIGDDVGDQRRVGDDTAGSAVRGIEWDPHRADTNTRDLHEYRGLLLAADLLHNGGGEGIDKRPPRPHEIILRHVVVFNIGLHADVLDVF